MRMPKLYALLSVSGISVASMLGQAPTPDTSTPATQSITQQPSATPAQGDATKAQPNPNGGYTIRRFSRLVVLDAVVVDKKGVPVRDLKKDDFSITEMGEPQTILNFEGAGANLPAPSFNIDSTASLDAQAPRAPVNIVVLDEFNTRFEDMAFARYSLKKFLEKQQGKLTTPTMLLAADLQHFTVLQDYTQDREALIKALNKHFAAYPWQTHNYTWIGERYTAAFLTLRRVALATMGHPGHKNMIWLGRGFPSFSKVNASVDQEKRVYNAVQDAINTLRDARITLYTIDPAGVTTDGGQYDVGLFKSDPLGGNYQFASIAKATGGAALYGRNDVDAEINTAIQDGAYFYALSYRPTDTSRDMQKFRRIVVKINRPDVKVLTREGYYLEFGPGRVDPEKPSRRLVSDLVAADTSKMTYDGVPLTVKVNPEKPETYLLHIPFQAVPWTFATDTQPRLAEFILMVSQFDKKGAELNRDAHAYKIAAPSSVPPTGRLERPLDLAYNLKHFDKAVHVRFTVRMSLTGRIGTADVDLTPVKK